MRTFPHLRLVALFLAPLPGLVAQAPATTPSIVGTWIGTDDHGAKGGFVFNADGTADMVVNGASVTQTMLRDQGTLTYRFDFSVTPHALDLVITRKDDFSQPLRCIIEFLSDDEMRLREPHGGERPKDFNGAPREIIVLHRQ